MKPRTESIAYRGFTIIVEYAQNGAVAAARVTGWASSFGSVEDAKHSIDNRLDMPPPLPEDNQPKARPRLRH